MKKSLLRILGLALCLCMIFGMLAGCGSIGSEPAVEEPVVETEAAAPAEDVAEEPAEAAAPTRDDYVIASASEPPTLHPIDQTSLTTMQMNLIMYNRLFKLDSTAAPVPDLVDTYSNVDDLTWTFTLREGIKFHDGTDLTSEDVKATLEYCQQSSFASAYVSEIDHVEVIDDLNFNIVTTTPTSSLIVNLTQSACSIVPSEKLESGHDFNAEPCGSGPYKFVEWLPAQHIKFEAFEDYFDGVASIKNLTWRFIAEDSARTIALEAGEVDYLWAVATIDLPNLEANDNIQFTYSPSVNLCTFVMNTEIEPYNNKDFRRAVSAAINRSDIVTAVLNGYGYEAFGCVPNDLAYENLENAVEPGLENAKAYLEASGVDPSTVTMTILCDSDTERLIGAVIQSNLMELGLSVELESYESAAADSMLSTGDFDCALVAVANNVAVNFCRRMYHSTQLGASNYPRYCDEEIDTMIDNAIATLDEASRGEQVSELEAYLNDLCLYVPLYNDMYIRAYDADLEGVTLNSCFFTDYHRIYWEK